MRLLSRDSCTQFSLINTVEGDYPTLTRDYPDNETLILLVHLLADL
jgi:hypothetical protein